MGISERIFGKFLGGSTGGVHWFFLFGAEGDEESFEIFFRVHGGVAEILQFDLDGVCFGIKFGEVGMAECHGRLDDLEFGHGSSG